LTPYCILMVRAEHCSNEARGVIVGLLVAQKKVLGSRYISPKLNSALTPYLVSRIQNGVTVWLMFDRTTHS